VQRFSLKTLLLGLLCTGFPLTVSAAPTQPGELQNELEGNFSCVTCHSFPNIEPHLEDTQYNPWAVTGTLMGNSAKDPVFWAAVVLASQDAPGDTEDCIRCHSPRAFLDGNGDATSIDELTTAEKEGINCDFCHRNVWDEMTPAGNAQYEIDDVADAETFTVPKRGPWAYEPDVHMGHPSLQDVSFIGTSRFCGSCHDVTTHRERVDDQGAGMGFDFNEQRTYSEWLNSDFANPMNESAATCQDCHMPAIADAAGCTDFNNPAMLHATGARKHDLVGANRFVLEILKEDYGTPAPNDVYQNAIDNMDAFLPSAATLEVTFPSEVDLASGIQSWSARVTNNSGHKLPTGYSEGRVMWLEISARYDGELVYSSGLWDPETLSIQSDEQARRYEGIAEDADDGTRLHLVRNNRWVSDSRIPAKGQVEDVQTDPVNSDYYALQMDGTWPHWDEANFTFPAAEVQEHTDAAAELELSVRLLYLINTDEYISTLADDNSTNSAGSDLSARFEMAGNAAPLVLAEDSITVPLSGLTPEPGEEESGSESTSTSSSQGDTDSDSESTGSGQNDAGGGACSCVAGDQQPRGLAGLGLLALLGWRRRRS
jgi:MYXO-CTERM domain-containing protein